jgi:hypothetical protein
MKCHKWTSEDEGMLIEAVVDCAPLFDHYKNQSHSYSDMNAWDAIAGRLLPDIVVTGAACRRHFEVMKERDEASGNADLKDEWSRVAVMVEEYERDLLDSVYDKVGALDAKMGKLMSALEEVQRGVEKVVKMWED